MLLFQQVTYTQTFFMKLLGVRGRALLALTRLIGNLNSEGFLVFFGPVCSSSSPSFCGLALSFSASARHFPPRGSHMQGVPVVKLSGGRALLALLSFPTPLRTLEHFAGCNPRWTAPLLSGRRVLNIRGFEICLCEASKSSFHG